MRDSFATITVFAHISPMSSKFHGSLSELKERLVPLGLIGEWKDLPNGIHKFQCKDKGGLSWSETKGTYWFDGPGPAKAALTTKVETVLAGAAPATTTAELSGSQIFVVHGRDTESRDQLELILRRLGLEPFVLQVTGGGGDTLIESLERMIGKTAQSAFGIVLATPDDMGYRGGPGYLNRFSASISGVPCQD
jgi:hypothetical protein